MSEKERLPILEGLSEEQFEKILSVCNRVYLSTGDVLVAEGQPSTDMFILTDGQLIVSLWGKEINHIFPVSPVGEMGLFTGELRSASVIARSECTLLRITKDDLFDLFANDKDLHIQFMLGMLIDLSDKLRLTNEAIAKLKAKASRK